MSLFLANKKIVLGITGSIAAYKSPDIVRRLRDAGASVRVAMTENAKRFITPLTLQAVSGYSVHDDLFDIHAEAAMGHIELARWADAVLIAPATADFMAKLAHGRADDLLTTLCLATNSHSKIIVAPAMNQGMWQHASTQENYRALQHKHIHIFGPAQGSQACGDVGPGRLLEPIEIIEKLHTLFATNLLAGLNVLITVGPTHEAIDPVRFISNCSSGKMGYALAEVAYEAGANVTIISGPVDLVKPKHLSIIPVTTAEDMQQAVMNHINHQHIFLAVAAVSDYRCKQIAKQKIHKREATMQLELIRNPDIVSMVSDLANKPFIVGFAAETENVIEHAKAKKLRKQMDMIIANDVGHGRGMGTDENEVTVIGKTITTLTRTDKTKLARELIHLIAKEFKEYIKEQKKELSHV